MGGVPACCAGSPGFNSSNIQMFPLSGNSWLKLHDLASPSRKKSTLSLAILGRLLCKCKAWESKKQFKFDQTVQSLQGKIVKDK